MLCVYVCEWEYGLLFEIVATTDWKVLEVSLSLSLSLSLSHTYPLVL